jgi:ABC-type sugar transport system substrate-binding protein
MKVKMMAMAILALFLFAGTAGLATAQDTTKTTHKKTRTLAGCLQKGDDANEYLLTTAKGSTWEIKSDSLKLGDHVGHKVAVTGVVTNAKMHGMKEDAKDEAKEHGVATHSTEHGHMTVTNLTMVSESCQK